MSASHDGGSVFLQQAVDDAVDAYVRWREESAVVWLAYDRWASAPAKDTARAHAAYRAALDQEEAAANAYAHLIDRVGGSLALDTAEDERVRSP